MQSNLIVITKKNSLIDYRLYLVLANKSNFLFLIFIEIFYYYYIILNTDADLTMMGAELTKRKVPI